MDLTKKVGERKVEVVLPHASHFSPQNKAHTQDSAVSFIVVSVNFSHEKFLLHFHVSCLVSALVGLGSRCTGRFAILQPYNSSQFKDWTIFWSCLCSILVLCCRIHLLFQYVAHQCHDLLHQTRTTRCQDTFRSCRKCSLDLCYVGSVNVEYLLIRCVALCKPEKPIDTTSTILQSLQDLINSHHYITFTTSD